MTTTISKWGNSLGIRLPKALLAQMKMREYTRVEVVAGEDGILIKPAAEPRKHIPLEERLKDWDGEPIETEEIDWGEPAGDEVW
jgi:antitoxin MazE